MDLATKNNPILIGITGASGGIYALRLVKRLLQLGQEIELIITDTGAEVLKYEGNSEIFKLNLKTHKISDYFAKPSSGSSLYHSMIVIPCSMGTIGKIANGTADNLLIRSADVFLKEKRKLILVPRESPFNAIHLKNMLALDQAGAMIIPASPSFYHHPKSIDELVDSIVERIIMQILPEAPNLKHWKD